MFGERRIQRKRGKVRLALPAAERALVANVVGELISVLESDPDQADLRRLFPPGYEDVEAAAEYRRLTHGDLLGERLRALETMQATLGRNVLTAAELEAWLRALNDVRLVLGTRLDVNEDVPLDDLQPDDPRGRELAVYVYLSALLEEVVAVVEGGLPEPGGS